MYYVNLEIISSNAFKILVMRGLFELTYKVLINGRTEIMKKEKRSMYVFKKPSPIH